jgi:hypothetical protein
MIEGKLDASRLLGHCAQHDSQDRQANDGGQHPPNGAVEPLFPFLEGLKFPLRPFHDGSTQRQEILFLCPCRTFNDTSVEMVRFREESQPG